MKNISKEQLRQLADKTKFPTQIDDDGDSLIILRADADFGYNVFVYLIAAQGWVSVHAVSPDFDNAHPDAAKLIALCNAWNNGHKIPTACYNIEKKRTLAKHSVLCDEDVSEQFIVDNCIKMGVQHAWQFFSSLVK